MFPKRKNFRDAKEALHAIMFCYATNDFSVSSHVKTFTKFMSQHDENFRKILSKQ